MRLFNNVSAETRIKILIICLVIVLTYATFAQSILNVPSPRPPFYITHELISIYVLVVVILIIYLYTIIDSGITKMRYIAVPYLVVVSLPYLWNGINDDHVFRDNDLLINMDLINKMLDPSLFPRDEATKLLSSAGIMQFYSIIFAPFVRIGISLPMISKILSVVASVSIPLLFFHLSLSIWNDRQVAYISGILSLAIPYVVRDALIGRPRTIGFLFFMLSFTCFMKFIRSKRRAYLFASAVVGGLTFLMHPTPTFAALCVSILAAWTVALRRTNLISSIKHGLLFLIILVPFMLPWLVQYRSLEYSSWSFLEEHSLIGPGGRVSFMRFPPIFPEISKLSHLFSHQADLHPVVNAVGYFVIFLSILLFGGYSYDKIHGAKNKHIDKKSFYAILPLFFIIILTILIYSIDGLVILRGHRYLPFVATFLFSWGMYFSFKHYKKAYINKISRLLMVLLVLFQSLVFSSATASFKIYRGDEYLIDAASWLKNNTPEDTLIACNVSIGDSLRGFSQRSVTASGNIGSFSAFIKNAYWIYQRGLANSRMLYENVTQLWVEVKMDYIVIESDETLKDSNIFEKVYSNKMYTIFKAPDHVED